MVPEVNPAFIIFAAISPLLIAFIKQSGFSRQVNALIALGCYVVIGVLGALLSGESLTLENAVNLIAVATVVGRAAYSMVWNVIGTDTVTSAVGGDTTLIVGESLDTRITDATSLIKG